jgi:hypothetical protein
MVLASNGKVGHLFSGHGTSSPGKIREAEGMGEIGKKYAEKLESRPGGWRELKKLTG